MRRSQRLQTIPTTQIFLSSANRRGEDLHSVLAAVSVESTSSVGGRIAVGAREADPAASMFAQHGYPVDARIAGYIEASGQAWDASEQIAALERMLDRLAPACDREACPVAVSQTRVLVGGRGPYALLHPLYRAEGTSPHDFHDYWGGGHAAKRAPIPELLGYLQHQVDPESSRRLGQILGLPAAEFDGVAQIFTASRPSYIRVMESRGAAGGVRDNASFVDVARSPYLALWHLTEGAER
jgi:EthD domain